jgi:hypothetical protein
MSMSIKAGTIFLLVAMSLAPISAGANAPAGAEIATPLDVAVHDAELGEAFTEALKILNDDTPCSRFFGGGSKAITVLRRLVARMKKARLREGVGIMMYGGTTTYRDNAGGAYRLFEHVAVNVEGPFYRSLRLFLSGRPVVYVGGWPPNTRVARVLMLLHELGHLIEGPGGGWLLPDDGDDWQKSEKNTEAVQKVCGEEVRSLR